MTVAITGGRSAVTVSDSGSAVTITGSRTGATIAEPAVGGGGVTAHSALTGLTTGDDHTQYALADGSRGSFAATGHTHSGTYEAVGVAAALVDDLSGVTNASTARTNLGLGTAATTDATAYDAAGAAAAAQAASQPLDSDLTAIAALSTTTYGRAFLALADAAAGRTALGLGTAATTASTAYDAAGVAAALVDDLSGVTNVPAARTALGAVDYTMPSGAIAITVPRYAAGSFKTIASGTLYVQAITLCAGQVVSSISARTATGPATAVTNQWFALLDSSRTYLAITANDTTTTWPSTSNKTLSIASPYTVTATGLYYVALLVAHSGTCQIIANVGTSGLNNTAPVLCGTSSTGLTTPPSVGATATALTAFGEQLCMWVS